MIAAAKKADLARWVASVFVALGLHAAAAAWLITRHDLVAIGEPSLVITVDLAPFATPPSDSMEDIAPGPKQQENDAPPPEPPKAEKSEKVDVPPTPTPSVAALPPPAPAQKPEPSPQPPVPITTAPAIPHASQADIDTALARWQRALIRQIDRHRATRVRGEQGLVMLSFLLDRQGRVLSTRVTQGSGHAELDREAMAAIQRAQPFPPLPAVIPDATFNVDVPVHFGQR